MRIKKSMVFVEIFHPVGEGSPLLALMYENYQRRLIETSSMFWVALGPEVFL